MKEISSVNIDKTSIDCDPSVQSLMGYNLTSIYFFMWLSTKTRTLSSIYYNVDAINEINHGKFGYKHNLYAPAVIKYDKNRCVNKTEWWINNENITENIKNFCSTHDIVYSDFSFDKLTNTQQVEFKLLFL